MGAKYILLTSYVYFKDNLKTDRIELLTNKMTGRIQNEYPLVKKIFIETADKEKVSQQ